MSTLLLSLLPIPPLGVTFTFYLVYLLSYLMNENIQFHMCCGLCLWRFLYICSYTGWLLMFTGDCDVYVC